MLPPRASRPELPPPTPPPYLGGSAKSLGLLSSKDREDTVTKAKSSDEDDLNDSANTVQRPVPPAVKAAKASTPPSKPPPSKPSARPAVPRPTPPRLDMMKPIIASHEEEDAADDELVTQGLIRPDLLRPDGIGEPVDDQMTTPLGHKKLLRDALAIKTPMAMVVGADPPSASGAPESGMTRVAIVQPPPGAIAQLGPSASSTPPKPLSFRQAIPFPLPYSTQTKALTLPPHKLALMVSMMLLAAALFIVFVRARNNTELAAHQPPPASTDVFPPAAMLPVEVANPPTVPSSLAPPPFAQAPAPAPLPTMQAQPAPTVRVAPTRRGARAAARPTIPVHREQ